MNRRQKRPGRRGGASLALVAALGMALAPVVVRAEAAESGIFGSVNQTERTITLDAPRTLSLPADAALPAAKLSGFSKGDVVRFTVSADGKIASIEKTSVRATVRQRLVAMAAGLVVVLGCALIASKGDLRAFILGADNRYSNSKTQLALWSTTVFAAYLATLLLRVWATGSWAYLGGIEIPGNLLVMSGLSALTFAGAKAVTTQQVNAAIAAKPEAKPPKSKEGVRPDLMTDLFRNDSGKIDIGDFQMILIALVAVVVYGFSCFAFLGSIELSAHVTLPDVDTTLLAGFGVGQGAYLTKKAASNVGDG